MGALQMEEAAGVWAALRWPRCAGRSSFRPGGTPDHVTSSTCLDLSQVLCGPRICEPGAYYLRRWRPARYTPLDHLWRRADLSPGPRLRRSRTRGCRGLRACPVTEAHVGRDLPPMVRTCRSDLDLLRASWMRKPLRLAVKGGPIIGAADKQCNNTAASKLNTWSAISDDSQVLTRSRMFPSIQPSGLHEFCIALPTISGRARRCACPQVVTVVW